MALCLQVADEAGLELNMDLPQAQSTSIASSSQASTEQVRHMVKPTTHPVKTNHSSMSQMLVNYFEMLQLASTT